MMTKTFSLGALALACLLSLAAPVPARAHDAKADDAKGHGAMARQGIAVTGAWARPTIAAMRTSAAYFQAMTAAGDDRLVAARTPVAGRAELHEHVMEGSIARMRPVEAVALAPGKPAVFRPGGYHVMLMELARPLKEGETFPLTLTFEKAGDVTVEVTVMKKAAPNHGNMGHGSTDHGAHKH